MAGHDVMLIAYDGSREARRALAYAGRFLSSERAIILTAWEPLQRQAARAAGIAGMTQPQWSSEDEDDPALIEARETCREGLEIAEQAGFSVEPYLIECSSAIWTAIVEAADQLDADIIVTGTRGTTGLRALLQSSVADNVLRHSHRPVLIVPPEADGPGEQ